jgi:N-acetylneuraminic acid mutarotase/plastocyanin
MSILEEEGVCPIASAPIINATSISITPGSAFTDPNTSGSGSPNISENTQPGFDPQVVMVVVGTTIKWINNDTEKHSVTSNPDNPGTPFDSQYLVPGSSFEWTFSESGEFGYFDNRNPCNRGEVIVVSSSGQMLQEMESLQNPLSSSSSSASSLPNISENTNTNTTQAWTFGANMPHPRTEIAGALLQTGTDKKIYTIGGYDISGKTTALNEAYTIGNDSWNNESPLPVAVNHAAAASFNGLIYVIGGYLQDNNQQPSDRLFIYDPSTGDWRDGARMPTARGALTANFVNGSLFVIGGVDNSAHPESTNEVYYPSNNTWKERAPMPTAREHLASAVVDEKLYAIGGRVIDTSTNLNVTEVYDPSKDAWNSSLAQMPSKRSGLAAAAINETIYVFGGEAADRAFNTTEEYDVINDAWATDVSMPTARHGLAAVAATTDNNNQENNNNSSNSIAIYVMGGASKPGLEQMSGANQIFHKLTQP